jgi:hypothetical protein
MTSASNARSGRVSAGRASLPGGAPTSMKKNISPDQWYSVVGASAHEIVVAAAGGSVRTASSSSAGPGTSVPRCAASLR